MAVQFGDEVHEQLSSVTIHPSTMLMPYAGKAIVKCICKRPLPMVLHTHPAHPLSRPVHPMNQQVNQLVCAKNNLD